MTTVPIQSNGLSKESSGVRVEQKGFKPPTQPQANMLTKEMAEAAAKKYKKDQKKIQKACAAVDPQTRNTTETSSSECCCCTIMWNKKQIAVVVAATNQIQKTITTVLKKVVYCRMIAACSWNFFMDGRSTRVYR